MEAEGRLRRLHRQLCARAAPVALLLPAMPTRPATGVAVAAARHPSERAAAAAAVPGANLVPARTSDPVEALRLLRRDGGVRFRAVPEGVTLCEREQREVAMALPRRIFGDGIAQQKVAERIAGGGWDGREWQGWQGVHSVDRGNVPNRPHMVTNPKPLPSESPGWCQRIHPRRRRTTATTSGPTTS